MVRNLVAAVSLGLACVAAWAQASQTDTQRQLTELKWLPPGQQGSLDGKAVFKTSDAFTFLSPTETDKFLQLNGNPPQGSAVTIAPVKGNWFGILRFAPEGYVKDDEKIDADQLLKSLKEQNAAGNEQKKKQGYQALVMEGWALPPRYDSANKRLEWGTLLRAEDKSLVANVSTRILGRSGYTSAVLVTSPETLDADLKDFKTALKDFDYVSGEKYSEWREGDKVAAYGLGALVLGGAAAAVSSKGGFKVIGLAVLGALAAVGAFIKKIFGRKS
jgi:uncharacterized membrane-anchored protein